jgi:hypothetical protein
MLKGIHPLLGPDLLHALRTMGHGDEIVIADANFPSDSVARQTRLGRLLRIDGASAGRVAKAILSVMPLDSFVGHGGYALLLSSGPIRRLYLRFRRWVEGGLGCFFLYAGYRLAISVR